MKVPDPFFKEDEVAALRKLHTLEPIRTIEGND